MNISSQDCSPKRTVADGSGLNPKTEIGRDGALRRHRAVQARNTFCEIERGSSIRSARCTRAGTAQRAFPTSKPGGTT
jgi:hypothetical protein